ncbi:MAG: glycosyltransferase family 4 protein [Deltaproteobacteria bacterium]
MKVALVCDWYHPRVGGIELHLQDLARRLMAAGHDVVAITPTPGAHQVDGVRVRRIDAPRAPRFGFMYTARGVRALGDAIASEHVDVAHCHVSIISPAALRGAREAERRGIPVVLTFHSVVPQTQLLARAARMALGTRRWSARFSAVSHRVASAVRPIAGTQPVSILPNGIDVGFWRIDAKPRRSAFVELLTVTRLNSKKRPLALTGIVRQANAMLANSKQVRLRIVGDGPQRARLERSIVRNGLTDDIRLLGHRTRDQIRELMSECDLFVLPTIRESFGLAALEARCAGLPVVAMASSGVAEIVHHGREGLLGRTDAELATHVATLSRDVERRRAIADHNRDTTPSYDWAHLVDAHVALYREAIAVRESV